MRLILLGVLLASCTVGDEEGEGEGEVDGDQAIEAVRYVRGVNGDFCVASPFNCRFHQGGSRVVTGGGDDSWGITAGASVRDGNGTALVKETASRLTFNFGQTRFLAGSAHALALTTANRSAGWYPIDHIKGEASFRDRMGEVNAKDPGIGSMACYQIRNSHDPAVELRKVVRNSTATHERAGDYLPLVRANGIRSANLVFSVPGFGLGGATTDHFPAGTKFQRVQVPTFEGHPSISIPLWIKAANGTFTKQSGEMRFLYGSIKSGGTLRWGWMAEDALEVSTGC